MPRDKHTQDKTTLRTDKFILQKNILISRKED